jgi:hypothetical protein
MTKHIKDPSSTSYPVGYGKPPEATRFQPGKSGNPTGRPKRRRILQSGPHPAIHKVLEEMVWVVEDGKRRRMPADEAMFRGVRTRAIAGDIRALKFLIELGEKYKKSPNYLAFNRLSDEELETVDRILTKAADGEPAQMSDDTGYLSAGDDGP